METVVASPKRWKVIFNRPVIFARPRDGGGHDLESPYFNKLGIQSPYDIDLYQAGQEQPLMFPTLSRADAVIFGVTERLKAHLSCLVDRMETQLLSGRVMTTTNGMDMTNVLVEDALDRLDADPDVDGHPFLFEDLLEDGIHIDPVLWRYATGRKLDTVSKDIDFFDLNKYCIVSYFAYCGLAIKASSTLVRLIEGDESTQDLEVLNDVADFILAVYGSPEEKEGTRKVFPDNCNTVMLLQAYRGLWEPYIPELRDINDKLRRHQNSGDLGTFLMKRKLDLVEELIETQSEYFETLWFASQLDQQRFAMRKGIVLNRGVQESFETMDKTIQAKVTNLGYRANKYLINAMKVPNSSYSDLTKIMVTHVNCFRVMVWSY